MLLESDLTEIFEAIIDERLADVEIKWYDESAACVIMASGGYPEKYEKGYEISGISEAESADNTVVFHAGTKYADGKLVTSGGRVLGVTAKGATLDDALNTAYKGVEKISFKDAHYRTDIGIKK